MSETTREYLDTFWELIDELLNAVLFVLIGLKVLALTFKPEYLEVGLMTYIVVVFSILVQGLTIERLLRTPSHP